MKFNEQLEQLILGALHEDVGNGDHSTLCCIPPETAGKAVLKIKQAGVLAGIQVASYIFKMLDNESVFTEFKADGDKGQPGEVAFEVNARVHTILKAERLVLNIMQRMSGISTLTDCYVEKIRGYKTKLLDTRKTTPNFRLLEKEAVRIGGGYNHRFGLFDMIMLKDNHIDFCGGIKPAIEKAYQYIQDKPGLKIEIETRNLDEVKQVLTVGKVHRIMLDNFTPDEIKKALLLIDNKFETEASGGIHLDNIVSYAATGVDFISSGAIIHQATSLDLSLKAKIFQ
ncbi:MAG: carboxylating nicotinate-nucleotide diphosphorylase [Ferruginibacter sp.]|nr:carboxylating nicotinate-nucleotide diphosphorylase [Ferruginibacter sp.]